MAGEYGAAASSLTFTALLRTPGCPWASQFTSHFPFVKWVRQYIRHPLLVPFEDDRHSPELLWFPAWCVWQPDRSSPCVQDGCCPNKLASPGSFTPSQWCWSAWQPVTFLGNKHNCLSDDITWSSLFYFACLRWKVFEASLCCIPLFEHLILPMGT